MTFFLYFVVIVTSLLQSATPTAHELVPTVERGNLIIRGHVTDSAGAPIPGVAILATAPGIALPRPALSGETGDFELRWLSAGHYTVIAQLPGFTDSVHDTDAHTIGAMPINFVMSVAPTENCPGLHCGVTSQEPANPAPPAPEVAKGIRLMSQTWDLSMQRMGVAPGNGIWPPDEVRRQAIYDAFKALGANAVPALIFGLQDPDVQMRRNADLILTDLAMGLSKAGRAKVDVRSALPALITALQDHDGYVRGWSAQVIGAIGDDGKEAVPALIGLLKLDEGSRNSACIALGQIGHGASAALPMLRDLASHDSSADVRRFAELAIGRIQ